MKSVLLIIVCFILIGCEEKPKYEKVEYIGKVQSTRFVKGGFATNSLYVLTIDGAEFPTQRQFRVNDDVYRVYRTGWVGSSLYNWNPLEVKPNDL